MFANRPALLEPLIDRLVEIHHHHHAGLHGDAVQGDVSDPDGHREVVAKQPLQDDATRHGVDDGEHHDCGFRHRVERQKEQHEYDEDDERDEDLEPLARAHLEFVLAGPQERVARWQLHTFDNGALGSIDVSADVASRRVDIDVAGQLAVLIAHHRRSG